MASIRELMEHGRVANMLVTTAMAALSDEQMDRPLDLGMGSLRRICQHLVAGEVTWLARIRGEVEAKWPARPISELRDMMGKELEATGDEMRRFVEALRPEQLDRVQRYRDSKGALFEATLHQMLLQVVLHSAHHRAQMVNAIRRVGGKAPEVDYMSAVRRAVTAG